MDRWNVRRALRAGLIASTALLAPAAAMAQNTLIDGNNGTLPLPTGLYVTPQLVPGAVSQFLNPGLPAYPNFVAGEAVKAVTSPDGTLLAVLTGGQNSLYNTAGNTDTANSTQYIFLYDVSGANKASPVLLQVLKQANSHVGLVWAPNGQTLYAAGGNDDAVYVYTRSGASLSANGSIALGHSATHGNKGVGLSVQPEAAGLAISADGTTLVVANNYNDSLSVIDTATKTVRYEVDLRPYASYNEGVSGGVGGTFPLSVAIIGTKAYVGCDRDREVAVVDISGSSAGGVVHRIKLAGNPNGMTVSADGSTLYVAQDNTDQVAVINTATNVVTANIDTRAPARMTRHEGRGRDRDDDRKDGIKLPDSATGAAPTAVTISGDKLYAVNAGTNSVAVIPLTGRDALTVTGLIPTAYDPLDIAFSADGSQMYIVNGKSDTGPNPGYGYGNTAFLGPINTCQGAASCAALAAKLRANNQYQFQLEHATLLSAPVPTEASLRQMTEQVAANNLWKNEPGEHDEEVMEFLRHKIKHVIYIVKENRTFDQILGDLKNGANGDPTLTLFGQQITPNYHMMATNFVTLDNFMDPGDGSMDGWSWSMRGRVTNSNTITQQQNYAAVNRGLSYTGEGQNRNVPVNLPTVVQRDAFFDATGATQPYTAATASLPGGTANLLPGDGDIASTDGPDGYQKGYIYDVALAAGHTVRNYGWTANTPGAIKDALGNPISDPFSVGVVQTTEARQPLLDKTDPYFRAYDQAYPDLWREQEFVRDVTANGLKNLSLIRGLSHDHTGSFGSALAGVNTPETQQADNDFAVGKLVDWLAHSQYAKDTLVFIIEDDCQDGADHVDSHRATTYVVGPYVKQHAVISTRYNQVNLLRTMEDILGTKHINLFTSTARPMTDIFDIRSNGSWTFNAVASTVLKTTQLQLAQADSPVKFASGPDIKPKHDWKYWARVTRGFDFSGEDRVPADLYNQVLWKGLKGNQPFPVPHHSLGLEGQRLSSN
jgi:YVTN family beta-propeller protein